MSLVVERLSGSGVYAGSREQWLLEQGRRCDLLLAVPCTVGAAHISVFADSRAHCSVSAANHMVPLWC